MTAVAYLYGPTGALNSSIDSDEWQTYPTDTAPSLAYCVVVSILSDARAPDDQEVADLDGDPRGWWADTYADGDSFGSLLWVAEQYGATPKAAALAADAARSALQWLIDDGQATAVDTACVVSGGNLELSIGVTRDERRETIVIPDLWGAYRAA